MTDLPTVFLEQILFSLEVNQANLAWQRDPVFFTWNLAHFYT